MSLAILSIGSELIDGRILDTNSQYLAHVLQQEGFDVRYHLSCDDNEEEILACLAFLADQVEHIILSGGLGPTSDDITRDVVAKFVGSPTERVPSELDRLRDYFESRGRPFAETNMRQAYFPKNAILIQNPVGTASGFECLGPPVIMCLPGVPREFQAMTEEYIIPRLHQLHPEHGAPLKHTFAIFGVAESIAGQMIEELNLSCELSFSYRASFPVLKITVWTRANSSLFEECKARIRDCFGQHIYAEEEPYDLVHVVHSLLLETKLTLSVAESCTGGMLGSLFTKYPGSSAYFIGGVQSYSNYVKEQELGVSKEELHTFGAVSEQVAKAMASGIRKKLGTNLALSITGIAGPDGGSPEKPVGTVYIGLASEDSTEATHYYFPFERNAMRKYTSYSALSLLRERLLKT